MTDSVWAELDEAAVKLIDERRTPGLSVSVLRQGRFVYSKGFGLANLETSTAATPKSVYLAGSITKQFTAAGLLQLAETGRLSVDDPLSKYFADFPRGREITLRQMLTHTSGLGTFTETRTREDFVQEARLDYDADALYGLMLATDPLYVHPPGTVWSYSNTAYVLLGLIAEKVAGKPVATLLKNDIAARAGLAETALDDAGDVVPRRASGYVWREGSTGRWDNASFISRTIAGGAGALRSTSEDICRWHEALLDGRIISASSLDQMITPHRLESGHLPKTAAGSVPVRYGFGLDAAIIDGRRTIGHHGSINGFSANLLSFPTDGVSIAILANCEFGPRFAAAEEAIMTAAVFAGARADYSRRVPLAYR